MGLKETLRSDLTEAIRSRDQVKSGTIRMILSAITNEEVAGKQARVLDDSEIITVLSREGKKRREAAEAYESAGSADRAELEKNEGAVIAGYLPQQLSEVEIKEMIAQAMAESEASGPSDMGKVMGILKPKVAGKADGRIVSGFVKVALTGGQS